ncbi:MAG: bifunctional phosphoserine phosphatase/homoserine phosphotransferase ThrH [Candidatus Hermodarchaeota archaeon]
MFIVCFDLEGVFTPEIWICIAEAKGIDELKITTRDEPDYDKLMKKRLKILKENGIKIKDIQNIIAEMELLPGAQEFMDWIRSVAQVAIITDNYKEFLKPILKKLGYPLCFHHQLELDENGFITNYKLTTHNMKKKAVRFFKNMNYKVIAVGDSYNDIKMLKEADYGILFKPPKKVEDQFPEFPIVDNYNDFKKILDNYLEESH